MNNISTENKKIAFNKHYFVSSLPENETYHDDDDFMKDFMKKNSYNKWDALENDTEIAEKFYSEMDDSHIASFMYSSNAVSNDYTTN